MRILVTGGTGLVGCHLLPALVKQRHDVRALSRRTDAKFPDGCKAVPGDPAVAGPWLDEVDRADAIVHLAGANVFAHRWTSKFKQEIYDSRINSTRLIAERLTQRPRREDGSPKVLVSASAVGYYGSSGDEELTEKSSSGGDFLAHVCVDWEMACGLAERAGVRVFHPRIGMVLAPDGGALKKLLTPFRLFVGGPVGGGKQWISWIHVADLVGMILFGLENPAAAGPMNAVAPEPLTNWGFCKTLGKVLNRPSWLPVPGWALRVALGEVASVVVGGQRVIPQRAHELGYSYCFPDLEGALRNLLANPLGEPAASR